MKESQVHSYIGPRDIKSLVMAADDCGGFADLSQIGINFDPRDVQIMADSHGMDALQPTVTAGSVPTPIQFLQKWLPGFVHVMTQARKIDQIVGIMTAGAWEDEEIVQGVLELTGNAVPYGDYANVPLSSWNSNWERRTVVRFEEGLQVGRLEEARAGRVNISSSSSKRSAAGLALEIQRNRVGFVGFNDGDGRTYGYLNDPGLPNYVTVAATGTGPSTLWSTKDFQDITGDIRTAVAALRASTGDNFDPYKDQMCITIAANRVDYLSVTTDFGLSVREWMRQTYPGMRVESAPELSNANGGASVFYLQLEKVNDSSTDGGEVFVQIVPAKFQVLGVQQLPKAYIEDFSNATAGVMCKRPYAVVRYTGI